MDFVPTDCELIAAVLDGERERFAEIVRRYRTPLVRAAQSRLQRRDWAEDVVQETFLCVCKSLHTYDSRYSFRTWLWTILLNQCRRRQKRESRQPEPASWLEPVADAEAGRQGRGGWEASREEAGPPAQAIARERAERLAELLDHLPEVQADALRLRFFGGLKFQEIADAMECSLSSAKSRVRLGLTRMSELMGHSRDAERAPTL